MRRREEEKLKREEEEARKLAEEEQKKKEETEAAKKEAVENVHTGIGVQPGDVCSAENDDVCQAETLNSVIEDTADETIAQAQVRSQLVKAYKNQAEGRKNIGVRQ